MAVSSNAPAPTCPCRISERRKFSRGQLMLTQSLARVCQIFQDEEYNRVVLPDEESFLKRHEAKMMIGHDEDKWVDGKAV